MNPNHTTHSSRTPMEPYGAKSSSVNQLKSKSMMRSSEEEYPPMPPLETYRGELQPMEPPQADENEFSPTHWSHTQTSPFITFDGNTIFDTTNVQHSPVPSAESKPLIFSSTPATNPSQPHYPTTSIAPSSTLHSSNGVLILPTTGTPIPSTNDLTVTSNISLTAAASSISTHIPSTQPVAVVPEPRIRPHCSICGLGDNGEPLHPILPVDGVAPFPSSPDLGLIMEFQLEWIDSPTNEDLLTFAHRSCLQHLGPDYFIDDTEPDQLPLVSSIISKRVGRLSLDTARGVHCGICDLSGGIVICRKCSHVPGSTDINKVWHTACMDRQLQQLKFMKNNLLTDDFLCHNCRPPKKERRPATHAVAANKLAVELPQTTPTKPSEAAIENPKIPIVPSSEPIPPVIPPPMLPSPLPSTTPLSAPPPPLPSDRVSHSGTHHSRSRSPPRQSRSRTPPHRRQPVPLSPPRSLLVHRDRSRSRSPSRLQRAHSRSKSRSRSRSRSPRRRPSLDHELNTPRLPLFPSATSTSALPPHMPYDRAPPDACYDFWNRGICSKPNCERPHWHPPQRRSRSPSPLRRPSHRSRSRSPTAPTRRRSRSGSRSRRSRSPSIRRRRSRSRTRSRSRSRSHHQDAGLSSRYPPLPPKYYSHCFHDGYSTPEIDYQTPHQPTEDPIDFLPHEAAFCFLLNGLILRESPFLITSFVPRKLIHHHPNLVMDELIRIKLITPSERLHLRWMSTMGPTRINVCMDSAQMAQEIIERASRRVTGSGDLVICPYQRPDVPSSTTHSSSSSSSNISDDDLLAELLTYFPSTEGEWILPSRLGLLYASHHHGESFTKRTGRSTIFLFLRQFGHLFDWREGNSEEELVRKRTTPSTVQTYAPMKKRPSVENQPSPINTNSMTSISTTKTSIEMTATLEDGEVTNRESLDHEAAANLSVVNMEVDGAIPSSTTASTVNQPVDLVVIPNTSSVLSPIMKRGASDEKTEAALKLAGLSKPPPIERLRSNSDDLLFSPAPPPKPKLVVTKRAIAFGSSPLPSSPSSAAAAAAATVTSPPANEFITKTGLSVAVKSKVSDIDPCFDPSPLNPHIWSCSTCGCQGITTPSLSTHLDSLTHQLGRIGQVVFQTNHQTKGSVWCTSCRLTVMTSYADEHIKNRHSDLLELLLPEPQSQSSPPTKSSNRVHIKATTPTTSSTPIHVNTSVAASTIDLSTNSSRSHSTAIHSSRAPTATAIDQSEANKTNDLDECFSQLPLSDSSELPPTWCCLVCDCLVEGHETLVVHAHSLRHQLSLIGQVVFRADRFDPDNIWCISCRLPVPIVNSDQHIKQHHADLLEFLLPESQPQSSSRLSTSPDQLTGIDIIDRQVTPEAKERILVHLIQHLLPPHSTMPLAELGSRFRQHHHRTFQGAIGMNLKRWLASHPNTFIVEPTDSSTFTVRLATPAITTTSTKRQTILSTPTKQRIHIKSASKQSTSHQPHVDAPLTSLAPTKFSSAESVSESDE